MIVDFLEYFLSDNYDGKVIIKNSRQTYNVRDIKRLVAGVMRKLKTVTSENIIIDIDDNLTFIVNFLACILAEKNIYLCSNTEKYSNYIQNPYVLNEEDIEPEEFVNLKKIDTKKIIINFYTSGSTSNAKCIKKSLQNLIDEGNDLYDEFKFDNGFEFASTTTLNHLFGMTFHFMLPFNNGLVINSDRIYFPEDMPSVDTVLISTPSFLEKMAKYDIKLKRKLKYTITAGAKLKDNIFKYAGSISDRVLEIYGSTETGVIAFRNTSEKPDFTLFEGIKILDCNNEFETRLISKYSYEPLQIIGDKIEWDGKKYIKFLGRSDRILKIQEKRISAAELEEETAKHEFANECYCFEHNGKIAAIVSLNPSGREFAVQNGMLELIKNLKTALAKKFIVIPQRWKFVDEIPRTFNGKIDKGRIVDLFNLNLSLPLVLSRKIDADCSEFRLFFYQNCNFFKGHFPKNPIVPGVVQLYYANYFTKVAYNKDCHIGQIRKIKFTNIIHANDIVDLRIEKQTKGMAYEYVNGEINYASGLLPHKNWFEEALCTI